MMGTTAGEVDLAPRTSFGSSIGLFLDRLHVERAYRSLRWTHHVRRVALGQLGPTGDRLGKVDPILDIVNITAMVVAVTALTIATPAPS